MRGLILKELEAFSSSTSTIAFTLMGAAIVERGSGFACDLVCNIEISKLRTFLGRFRMPHDKLLSCLTWKNHTTGAHDTQTKRIRAVLRRGPPVMDRLIYG